MKAYLLFSVLFLCLTFTVNGRKIKFTDCGPKNVKWIDVDPCSEEPCRFEKNTTVTATSNGIVPVDAKGGTLLATVLLEGIEVEYPGIESDVCKLLKCPLVKGEPFELAMKIPVADFFPSVSSQSCHSASTKYRFTDRYDNEMDCRRNCWRREYVVRHGYSRHSGLRISKCSSREFQHVMLGYQILCDVSRNTFHP